MKIGLFFGSFNPIHVGHLIIASYMVDFTDIEQVWFIVSPQNPLKNKNSLLSEYSRLELIQDAIMDDNRLKVLDIEFKMPKPSYTIDTLDVLKKKYPENIFSLIMGTDTISTLPKWKSFVRILNNFRILSYPRPNYPSSFPELNGNIELVSGVPLMEISATFIRSSIKNNKSVKYLLPEKVFNLIEKSGYYL